MEPLYVYFIKVNVAVAVFYVFYRILFNKDTFFEIRRFCLMTILGLSLLYPTIDLSAWLGERQQAIVSYVMSLQGVSVVATVAEEPSFTWENLLLFLYLAGVAVLLLRMLFQLVSILRLALKGEKQICLDTPVLSLGSNTAPFSFFKWIFVNPEEHALKEIQEIIAHEKTHVSQWHSIDMIVSELVCTLLWFNPMVWLLKREICQNLEFLADQHVISSGYNRKNYQYHLLRLSHQSAAAQLVNNFNVSQLKKRITMMNQKKTSRLGLIKYALLLPVTVLLILSGNVEAIARVAGQMTTSLNVKNMPVKGKVTDEKGKVLPGVTVLIKNTSRGVVTNANGEYSIETQPGQTLCFSFVGKSTQFVPVTAATKTLNINLAQESAWLEPVVVVGYVNDKKDALEEEFSMVEEMPVFIGETVQKFLAKNIKYPVRAQEEGIQGKVIVNFIIDKTGKVVEPKVATSVNELLDAEALRVVMAMPDWKPGKQRGQAVDVEMNIPVEFRLAGDDKIEKYSITVSGSGTDGELKGHMVTVTGVTSSDADGKVQTRTVQQSGISDALIVVDGKEMPEGFNINTLNPNDIESISILKDKSAMALYGERGKKGVIIITMKNK